MGESKHERAEQNAIGAYMDFVADGGGDDGAVVLAINTYLATMREPGPGEVRVRVCVAVNATGGAMWVGGNGLDDEGNRGCTASTGLDRPLQYRWIEANVPAYTPPAETTVEGECVTLAEPR